MKRLNALFTTAARSLSLSLSCGMAFLAIPGCTRFGVLNAMVPHCGYARTRDISYGQQPRQKLDVYRPTRGAMPAAVVVFFYGGDWQCGRKGDYRFVAQALSSRGFVTVLPDYRLYPSVTFPAFVQDGASAVRWVRDNIGRFGGDPNRIYLMGHSAGAHIAALLTLDAHYLSDAGVDRSTVRATAALSGPFDFVPPSYDRAAFGMPPGAKKPDLRIEPIHFADGRAPPMLLVHGLKDQTVDPANARNLAAKIREAGGEVSTIYYPNRAHVGVVLAFAWPFRWLAPVLQDTTDFFREHDSAPASVAGSDRRYRKVK